MDQETPTPKTLADQESFINSPLAVVYWGLRGDGYAHNVALWAAWFAHTDKTLREAVGLPDTQKAFAEWLGVSDRTIRNYAKNNPDLATSAKTWMVNSLLSEYVPGALKAMGQAAGIPNNYGTGDRRLLFEMLGVYKQRVDLTSGDEPVKGITIIEPVMPGGVNE